MNKNIHLLSRATFGPMEKDLALIQARGKVKGGFFPFYKNLFLVYLSLFNGFPRFLQLRS